MELTFIGIHETPVENAEDIFLNGFRIPEQARRNSWLGTAIYFWDNNIELGHWWAVHRTHGSYAIFKSQIRVAEEHFLDLTSPQECQKLYECSSQVKERLWEPGFAIEQQLGVVIDTLSRHYEYRYDVIRGVYEGLTRPMLFTGPRPLIDVKMVLAVRNPACIGKPVPIFRSPDD